MLLFDGTMIIGAGAVLLVAAIDKVTESIGMPGIEFAIGMILPVLAIGTAIYFIETMPFIWWVR